MLVLTFLLHYFFSYFHFFMFIHTYIYYIYVQPIAWVAYCWDLVGGPSLLLAWGSLFQVAAVIYDSCLACVVSLCSVPLDTKPSELLLGLG